MQKVGNFLIYIFLYYIILEKKFKSFIISCKIREKREEGGRVIKLLDKT